MGGLNVDKVQLHHCEICEKKFRLKNTLYAHVRRSHSKAVTSFTSVLHVNIQVLFLQIQKNTLEAFMKIKNSNVQSAIMYQTPSTITKGTWRGLILIKLVSVKYAHSIQIVNSI